jgi:ATP-dependent Lhr-like helicase
LRNEITPCPPAQFADFVLRWQGLHPDHRHADAEGVAEVLARLQGLGLPAELWEQTVLPGRLAGYQPRWLDQCVNSGDWVWACRGDEGPGAGLLAFWERENLARLPAPESTETRAGDPLTGQVGEHLRLRGALFVTDLAQLVEAPPSAVRTALWALLRRGLATNDQLEVVRKGEPGGRSAEHGARNTEKALRAPRATHRAPRSLRPSEGRWSLIPWGRPDPETHTVFLARVLLGRYGVAARELALLDPGMPPWRSLYEVLGRMELAGDVRRGYFVEGLSGAQFALPEAAQMLSEVSLPPTAAAPALLVHSQDPGNLYGSGAPFDIPLLDGGTRPLIRRPGNWLVLRGGRPVLIAEQQGRNVTALASASHADVVAAVACLPGLLATDRGLAARHRLTVAQWNGQPVTATEGRELLEAVGFVRDYQELTLYAAWR